MPLKIGSSENLLGRCNPGRATAANNATIQADGRLLNHSGTVNDMSQNGFWPTELNVMRGIVTSQETGVGKPFNNMPTLPAISTGNQYSTAEHYINFIGKEALKKIKQEGIKRKQVGLELDCEPLKGPNTTFWPIYKDGKKIGKVTSAVYSPRLKKNIALAMVEINHSDIGNTLKIISNREINSKIIEKPFYDPKKKIASS